MQTEIDNTYFNVHLHPIETLDKENELLKSQLVNVTFSVDRFSNNDNHILISKLQDTHDILAVSLRQSESPGLLLWHTLLK